MRYLSFLLVSLFFVISCGDNEEKFASLDSESRHSSETSEYRQELQSMVEDQEPRVGGKKRNGLNIKKTVGDNSVIKKHKFVTNIHVANIVIEGSPAGESADGSDGTADSGDQKQGDTADSGDHKQEVEADSGDHKQELEADSGDQKQEVVADSGDQNQGDTADSGDQKQEVEADSGDQNTEKIVVDFGNKEQEEVVADSGDQKQEVEADSGDQKQEVVADSGDQKQEVEADSEVFNEHPVMSGKQLDLLFYMETRDSNCIRNIKKYAYQYGFLEYLDHLSWQVGFSFYTEENESKLIPLHSYNGQPFDADRRIWSVKHDFILSRWEYSEERRDHLFRTTLEASYPDYSEGSTRTVFPNSNGFVFNPLSGLDHFLDSNPEKFLRKNSQTVVIISGDAFPYYNAKEWDRFFKKHKDVDFIAVSYRSANISNFMHILNKAKYNFEYVPACDTMQSTDKLLEAIDEKVQ